MKNLFVSLYLMLLVVFITSCEGTKKSSDNQSVSTQSQGDEKQATAIPPDVANSNDTSQASANHVSESLTGTQLVDNAANRLITKLGLNTDQENKLRTILTKTFVGMGEDLNKIYTVEQSRTIGRDIIQKSTDPIMALLDANQKEQFKKFGSHQ